MKEEFYEILQLAACSRDVRVYCRGEGPFSGSQAVSGAGRGAQRVLRLADAAAVQACALDIRPIAALQGEAGEPGERIVCAPADPSDDVDVVDRFFAPGCGIDEDPATGSAHCTLAPLYADKLGRPEVRFRQVFPGRGGDIATVLNGDRVLLRGQAVTVIESRLRV